MLVDDNHAVIDVAQDRQHGDIGFRQAPLQTMALHGVLENGFLGLDGDVIGADVSLGAGTNGGNTAVFPVFRGQRHNRVVAERRNHLG